MSSDADVAVTNPNSRQSPRDFPDAMTGRAAYCGARLETIRPGRATVQTAKETDVDQVVAAATDYLTSFYSGTAEERRARIHKVLYPDLVKAGSRLHAVESDVEHFLQRDGADRRTQCPRGSSQFRTPWRSST